MSEEQTVQSEIQSEPQAEQSHPQPRGITRITVQGFKSLRDETSIEIRPLTILAGANSSGKSSIMQPLLLMKQTLESPYDPGPLKLDGPNVWFEAGDQPFSFPAKRSPDVFAVGIGLDDGLVLTDRFEQHSNAPIQLARMSLSDLKRKRTFIIEPGMRARDIAKVAPPLPYSLDKNGARVDDYEWKVVRDRCFFSFALALKGREIEYSNPFTSGPSNVGFNSSLHEVIHVPGNRSNTQQGVANLWFGEKPRVIAFSGPFELYVGRIIEIWQSMLPADDHLAQLSNSLRTLGLSRLIQAKRVGGALRLYVSRLPYQTKGDKDDVVSISQVGLGAQFALPVLVSLLIAEPGQLVYIEQPELHLHPDAQVAMAGLLADAAKRGVRVVVETHSNLLLLAVQTLLAEESLKPEEERRLQARDAILHWFKRDDEGVTRVTSVEFEENGAFGEWRDLDLTYDFGQVEARLQQRYIHAASANRVKIRSGNGTRPMGIRPMGIRPMGINPATPLLALRQSRLANYGGCDIAQVRN